MKPETTSLAEIAEALASIQSRMAEMGGELARMNERIAAVEADQAAERAARGVGEDVILVIGAAIAAFLGKKAHIRHVHLLGSASWSQQGRVTIQGSHALNPARSQP